MIMKPVTIAKAFAITVATALVLGMVSKALAADNVCSNATLKGTFAFTSTGFITPPAPAPAQPFAIVGTQTFDGNGAFTAAGTVSLNGKIIPVTLEGRYTVNPECAGTFTAHISPVAITTNVFFVIDDNGKGFQAIQTDSGVVVTAIARRQ